MFAITKIRTFKYEPFVLLLLGAEGGGGLIRGTSTFQKQKWYPHMIMKKDRQKCSRLRRYGRLNTSHLYCYC